MKRRVRFCCRLLAGFLVAMALTSIVQTPVIQAQGAIGASSPASDPTGATTGTAKDVGVKDPKNPTLAEVMDTVGHNKIAINVVWTLLAGFLVMFMQAGFALVETGFTRAKNVAHTMGMNFMVYAIGMLGYWICGYALQMGGVGAVVVTFKAGKKTISTRKAKVTKSCTFRSKVKFSLPSRLHPKTLRVQSTFRGNAVLTSRASKRSSVKVG